MDLLEGTYYIVYGISGNSVIETLIIEAYQEKDVYYYLLDQIDNLKQYQFIHKTVSGLVDMYKFQYGVDPNAQTFGELINQSDELSNDFVNIKQFSPIKIINACNYFENNKKTITLKKTGIKLKNNTDEEPNMSLYDIEQKETAEKPVNIHIGNKTKIQIKPKKTIILKK